MGFFDKFLVKEDNLQVDLKQESSLDKEYLKFLDDIKRIFPNESLRDVISFLKDLKGMLPVITSADRLNGGLYDLKNVISVVYSLMYGDSLERYASITMRYSDAEKSLLKLSEKVNEGVIVRLRDEKRDLTAEVDTLNVLKTNIEEENAVLLKNQQLLGDRVEDLACQVKNLENRKCQLKVELCKLEENGKHDVEALIAEEKLELDREFEEYKKQVEEDKKIARSSISTEIKTLEARRDAMENAIKELENSLSIYDKTIDSLSQGEVGVTVKWELIKSDDPIYSIGPDNFNDYCRALLEQYRDETGFSMEKAKQEFTVNCLGIFQLKTLYNDWKDSYRGYTTKELMSNSTLAHTVTVIIKNMKMPVYEKNKSQLPNSIIPVKTINPHENVRALLRELDLQKKLIQVSADARIYQAYATTLIQILTSITPPDMDLSNLLSTYGMSNEFIQLLSSSTFENKNNSDVKKINI